MANNLVTWETIDPKVRRISMVGLALAMLIACFDGTIVGTCGPTIAADLNGTALYAWMITAYMLCETVMIPISGKMSDHYGRKPLFLLGLGLFVGGSVLAGMSTSMEMLVVCRAIQGLGGGTLIPVAVAAVGDFYSPAERGKIQGILGAIFGIGSAIGPLLGGYITENISWHWIFYINVPLAIVSLFLTLKKFPAAATDTDHKIDYIGMGVLGVFLIDLLLFFEWAGSDFAWVSVESIAMIVVAVILLLIFAKLEMKADDPVLSPALFHDRTIIACMIFMMIFGIGMMGAMTYSSMFSIYIYGLTTMEAGYLSLAMVAGMMITSLASGNFLLRTGYKPWLITGPIVTAISLFGMSTLKYGSDVMGMATCLFFLGAGLGCMMSVVMVAAQNAAKSNQMGMTTSSVNLMRSIGCTVGTAIFAMVITQRLTNELSMNLSPELFDIIPHDTGALDPYWLFQDPIGILTSFANSVDFAFLAGGLIMLILIVVGFFIKAERSKKIDVPVKEPETETAIEE